MQILTNQKTVPETKQSMKYLIIIQEYISLDVRNFCIILNKLLKFRNVKINI